MIRSADLRLRLCPFRSVHLDTTYAIQGRQPTFASLNTNPKPTALNPKPQNCTALLADIDVQAGAGGPFHEHGDALAQDEELLNRALWGLMRPLHRLSRGVMIYVFSFAVSQD